MDRPARYTHYPRSILWLIEGGEITLGGHEADAQPRFGAEVESFYISKFPITNLQFAAFDPGHQCRTCSPSAGDPATGICWQQARDYAAWYAEVSRKAMRLPTEIEWEYACRGGCAGRWPWGDDAQEIDRHLWHAGNSDGRVGRLDSKASNGFGLWAMVGGVWEWTASDYRPYPLAASGESSADESLQRVLRGGSFRLPGKELSCSLRRAAEPSLHADDVGFRIAKSLR